MLSAKTPRELKNNGISTPSIDTPVHLGCLEIHIALSNDNIHVRILLRVILGPFIRGKIRRVLFTIYTSMSFLRREQLVQMVRVLFLFLTRFHVNVARSNGNPKWRAKN